MSTIWTLIILFGYSSQSISGYSSLEKCLEAAGIVRQQAKQQNYNQPGTYCVPKG